mgnify:FL=1
MFNDKIICTTFINYRRDSRKLPIGDPDIDWEETVYLNLVVHLFDYRLTLAICTRTSPSNLQVGSSFTDHVHSKIRILLHKERMNSKS